jgi:hypothetical protein
VSELEAFKEGLYTDDGESPAPADAGEVAPISFELHQTNNARSPTVLVCRQTIGSKHFGVTLGSEGAIDFAGAMLGLAVQATGGVDIGAPGLTLDEAAAFARREFAKIFAGPFVEAEAPEDRARIARMRVIFGRLLAVGAPPAPGEREVSP